MSDALCEVFDRGNEVPDSRLPQSDAISIRRNLSCLDQSCNSLMRQSSCASRSTWRTTFRYVSMAGVRFVQ